MLVQSIPVPQLVQLVEEHKTTAKPRKSKVNAKAKPSQPSKKKSEQDEGDQSPPTQKQKLSVLSLLVKSPRSDINEVAPSGRPEETIAPLPAPTSARVVPPGGRSDSGSDSDSDA